jgi:hypothetical protein
MMWSRTKNRLTAAKEMCKTEDGLTQGRHISKSSVSVCFALFCFYLAYIKLYIVRRSIMSFPHLHKMYFDHTHRLSKGMWARQVF